MKWQLASSLVAVLAPVMVIAYDIVVALFVGPQATITAVIRIWAEKWHELPYLFAAAFFWLWLHLFFALIVRGPGPQLTP